MALRLQQQQTDQSLKSWQLPASVSLRKNHQESRHSSPGTLLQAWQALAPWTLWMEHLGLNKMAFLYESIQPALLSKAFTTKDKAKYQKNLEAGKANFRTFRVLSKTFQQREWKPLNSATADTFLESKGSEKLSSYPRKTKEVRIKWTSLIINKITNFSLTRCGTSSSVVAYSYCL